MNFDNQIRFEALIEPIARRLLGEPNTRLSKSKELRFGCNGSLSVDLEKGAWFDHENTIGGGVVDLIKHKLGYDRGGAIAWLRREGLLEKPAIDPKPRFVCAYDYVDESGKLLFQVLRYEPKSFRQRQANGAWNLKGVRRVLYNLPGVIEAAANGYCVCIVEGEEDVKILLANNIPATTCPGGAGKWRDEYNEFLRDIDVILIPDNDKPGGENVRQVAESLNGVAKSIGILDLAEVWPECPEKGDIRDWFKAGGTAERLWELIDATPLWVLRESASPNDWWRAKLIDAQSLCDLIFPEIRYVIPGLFPEGVVLLVSRPKLGKSWLLLQIGAAVANGTNTLASDDRPPVHGDVLYLALEDNPKRLQRRLKKLFGPDKANWPARLKIVTEWRRLDQGGLEALRAWCDSVANPLLIMIDTLKRVRAPKGKNQSDYDADYEASQGLQQLGGELGLTIMVAHHDRKMDAEDVFDTVSGTLGLTGGVDTIAILKRKGMAVTLHIEGRDLVELVEKAVSFDRETCRWVILGEAAEVQQSNERSRVLAALNAAPEGLSVSEIAVRACLTSRGAADHILGRMADVGYIERIKRGLYGLPGTKARIAERVAAEIAAKAAARANAKASISQSPTPREMGEKGRLELSTLKYQDDEPQSPNLPHLPNGGRKAKTDPPFLGPPDDILADLHPERRR